MAFAKVDPIGISRQGRPALPLTHISVLLFSFDQKGRLEVRFLCG